MARERMGGKTVQSWVKVNEKRRHQSEALGYLEIKIDTLTIPEDLLIPNPMTPPPFLQAINHQFLPLFSRALSAQEII